MSDWGTTSSAKRMVDMARAPSSGRMAARYCFLRMTTVPMPALPSDSMAASSSRYGRSAASPSGPSQYVRS